MIGYGRCASGSTGIRIGVRVHGRREPAGVAPAVGQSAGPNVDGLTAHRRDSACSPSPVWRNLRRGEVLVCPITNPAWSVVFSQAGALITDAGSVPSHSAIVAREHALPAVVATGDATRRLRDGMEVTIDGSRGTIVLH